VRLRCAASRIVIPLSSGQYGGPGVRLKPYRYNWLTLG
jgi:hypothetical protein